ncbi:MAG: hypothetical protein AAF467_15950 [Actinomycetota bacterium]
MATHRHQQRITRSLHPLTIEAASFRDAYGTALAIADLRRLATVVATVDGSGAATRHHVHHGADPKGTLECLARLVGWAEVIPAGTEKAIIITVDPEPPAVVAPGLRVLRRWIGSVLRTDGVNLLDWLVTDGDVVASLAFTDHARTAWPDDPPHLRLLHQAHASLDVGETKCIEMT